MSLITDIKKKIDSGQYEFSKHAVDQSIIRKISVKEVREVFRGGEVIEDYPEDKYGPSCLVFGLTRAKRPIHIQCSYPSRQLIKIITMYEPSSENWLDFRKRKVQ